jgi:hypothetical protein
MTIATAKPGLDARIAALLIGGAALLELVIISHHPVAPRSATGRDAFEGIRAVMRANLGFHAALMLALVAQWVGLLLFAVQLGFARPIVLTGSVLCGIASFMLIAAMTFDGFVTFEIVNKCTVATAGCTPAVAVSLRVVLAVIQAFTKLGFSAQCLGFAPLGCALWANGGMGRWVALACIAAALSPILLLALGGSVGPLQLAQVLGLLAVWGLLVAALLIRRAASLGHDASSGQDVSPPVMSPSSFTE